MTMDTNKNGTRVSYRMGPPDPERDYVRPVQKVVDRFDEGNAFTIMAKDIAPDLETFRQEFPDFEVEGAPTLDEVRLVMQDFSTADLAALGLSRTHDVTATEVAKAASGTPTSGGDTILDVDDTLSRELFASDEAYMRAKDAGWSDLGLEGVAGAGTGKKGTLTSLDVRTLIGD